MKSPLITLTDGGDFVNLWIKKRRHSLWLLPTCHAALICRTIQLLGAPRNRYEQALVSACVAQVLGALLAVVALRVARALGRSPTRVVDCARVAIVARRVEERRVGAHPEVIAVVRRTCVAVHAFWRAGRARLAVAQVVHRARVAVFARFAVHRRVLAATCRCTRFVGARIAVIAEPCLARALAERCAGVLIRALVAVVARLADLWFEHARTVLRVARVECAGVVVVARQLRSTRAHALLALVADRTCTAVRARVVVVAVQASGRRIAGVVRAGVAVIAFQILACALFHERAAHVVFGACVVVRALGVDRCAVFLDTLTICLVAVLGRARIEVVACLELARNAGASETGVRLRASVAVRARLAVADWREDATARRFFALVVRAHVRIVAVLRLPHARAIFARVRVSAGFAIRAACAVRQRVIACAFGRADVCGAGIAVVARVRFAEALPCITRVVLGARIAVIADERRIAFFQRLASREHAPDCRNAHVVRAWVAIVARNWHAAAFVRRGVARVEVRADVAIVARLCLDLLRRADDRRRRSICAVCRGCVGRIAIAAAIVRASFACRGRVCVNRVES